MTILYDQSVGLQGLVAGTSNKSELLLGYGTQFGDMASAVNPVGDLYKTQLYQIGRLLGRPAASAGKTADRRPLDRPDRRRRIGIPLCRRGPADGS